MYHKNHKKSPPQQLERTVSQRAPVRRYHHLLGFTLRFVVAREEVTIRWRRTLVAIDDLVVTNHDVNGAGVHQSRDVVFNAAFYYVCRTCQNVFDLMFQLQFCIMVGHSHDTLLFFTCF